MLLSAVSVLIVAQSSSEIPEALMNNPVHDSRLGACSVHTRKIVDVSVSQSVVRESVLLFCSSYFIVECVLNKGTFC